MKRLQNLNVLEGYTTYWFLTGTSMIAYGKYSNDVGKVLLKESNVAVTLLGKTGSNSVLSFTHQASSTSFGKNLPTVGSTMN